MAGQTEKPAGKVHDPCHRIVGGAVIDDNHLEVVMAGRENCGKALLDGGSAVTVGNDDGEHRILRG
jgi:hypothetical protein